MVYDSYPMVDKGRFAVTTIYFIADGKGGSSLPQAITLLELLLKDKAEIEILRTVGESKQRS